jgi:hypothetical protein
MDVLAMSRSHEVPQTLVEIRKWPLTIREGEALCKERMDAMLMAVFSSNVDFMTRQDV